MMELQGLPGWEEHPAVRAGKVYYIHEYWNGDDAFSGFAVVRIVANGESKQCHSFPQVGEKNGFN